jgi:D-lactate dehydrogenase (cytochrome)
MNLLDPRPLAGTPGECIRDPALIAERHADHLGDESRLRARRIAALHLPASTAEVAAALAGTTAPIGIAGARTGIAGGAVPAEGAELVALDRLRSRPLLRRRADGSWTIRVGAATTLAELDACLRRGDHEAPDGPPPAPLFYPVDATEASAQLGGTIATNASGARSFAYGPTRAWVEGLTVVLADGRVLELTRGQVHADAAGFRLRLAGGGERLVPIVDLPLPPTKHTLGYPLARGLDAVDLFIGSEGTLGVITAAELRLTERPRERLFLMQFVAEAEQAAAYAAALKARRAGLLAIEFFGREALDLVRQRGALTEAALDLARLPADARAAVYVEAAFADEAALDALAGHLERAAQAAGADPRHSWAGFAEADAAAMRRLRHALPESVNALIGERQRGTPGLHKVGTDMAVPDAGLPGLLGRYAAATAGLETVLFGHLGDGHLHLNVLPRDLAELARAKALYGELARAVVALGGSVAAEHGIGRLKRDYLRIQFDAPALAALWAVKRALDPDLRLNPGVLLPEEEAIP